MAFSTVVEFQNEVIASLKMKCNVESETNSKSSTESFPKGSVMHLIGDLDVFADLISTRAYLRRL